MFGHELLAYAEFLRDLERVGGLLTETFNNPSPHRILNDTEDGVEI
jgi:hypothetical protein